MHHPYPASPRFPRVFPTFLRRQIYFASGETQQSAYLQTLLPNRLSWLVFQTPLGRMKPVPGERWEEDSKGRLDDCIGLSRSGRGMLSESQRLALLLPGDGKPGFPHQTGGGEIFRMAALENSLCDVRGEEA